MLSGSKQPSLFSLVRGSLVRPTLILRYLENLNFMNASSISSLLDVESATLRSFISLGPLCSICITKPAFLVSLPVKLNLFLLK